MLPNQIVLAVNELNDDGTVPEVIRNYSRYIEHLNRSEYISDDHTLAVRDKLGFYRTFQKKVGNFAGVAKAAAKITSDYSVVGNDSIATFIAPGIIDIGFSLPVGMTPVQIRALRMRAAALLCNEIVMVPLAEQLNV